MSLGGIEDPVRSRRNLIAGAAVAGASLTLARPLVGAIAGTPEPCDPESPGRPVGAIAMDPIRGAVWAAHPRERAITTYRLRDLAPRGHRDVGGAPLDIAIAPHGTTALVVTAEWDEPGLAVVDLRTRKADRMDAGADPRAVAFSHGGRAAYVAAGGAAGTLTRLNLNTLRLGRPVEVGAHPRDVAIAADGRTALVTLNADSAVALVDLTGRRAVRRIAVPAFPSRVAISPDGRRALVTHDGFGQQMVTPIDLRERRAGRPAKAGLDPGGVAFSPSGGAAAVSSSGEGHVAVIDPRRGRRIRTVKVPGAPRALAVTRGRLLVADAQSGALHSLRVGSLR